MTVVRLTRDECDLAQAMGLSNVEYAKLKLGALNPAPEPAPATQPSARSSVIGRAGFGGRIDRPADPEACP